MVYINIGGPIIRPRSQYMQYTIKDERVPNIPIRSNIKKQNKQ